jgi:pimeloyl-ACP methyl ester carboxylesterase
MHVDKKERLYQGEADWLATGKFSERLTEVNGYLIRNAVTMPDSDSCEKLVVFVGGIPKDAERQKKLPLINKLFGLLAIKLSDEGIASLMYNQPGTGGSSGNLDEDTLIGRTAVLEEPATATAFELGVSRLSLVGMSAGSYMASRASKGITEQLAAPLDELVLMSPALFPQEVEQIPYGQEFRSRVGNGWQPQESPAIGDISRALENSTRVHITYFEVDDPPIPLAIQQEYRSLAEHAPSNHNVSFEIIEGVEHNFRRMNYDQARNVVDNDAVRRSADSLVGILN